MRVLGVLERGGGGGESGEGGRASLKPDIEYYQTRYSFPCILSSILLLFFESSLPVQQTFLKKKKKNWYRNTLCAYSADEKLVIFVSSFLENRLIFQANSGDNFLEKNMNNILKIVSALLIFFLHSMLSFLVFTAC